MEWSSSYDVLHNILCFLLILNLHQMIHFYLFFVNQELGEDLVNVLDTLRVKYVIGMGVGAGANIMMRFGMVHSKRCLGIVLLHPTAMNATLFDNISVRHDTIVISAFNSCGR